MASLDFEKEKNVFREFYNKRYDLFKGAASSFSTLVALLLADNDKFDNPRVTFRVKDREECIKKFERKYLKKLEEEEKEYAIKDFITDIIGLRVVSFYETDIESIRDVLITNLEVIDVTDKTHSLEEKDDVFGYKALHLDLKLNQERLDLPEYSRFGDLRFEIQIRTIVQDAWSVLDHRIKYKRNIPHELKRRINRMAALFELADQEFVNIRTETVEFEQKAKESKLNESTTVKKEDTEKQLDAFLFLKVVNDIFSDYEFYGYKIDGFIDELKNSNPDISAVLLKEALEENKETIDEYREYQYENFYNNLNPYTILRHVLYLKDKEKYKALLFEMQKNNFEKWLTRRST